MGLSADSRAHDSSQRAHLAPRGAPRRRPLPADLRTAPSAVGPPPDPLALLHGGPARRGGRGTGPDEPAAGAGSISGVTREKVRPNALGGAAPAAARSRR